MTEQLKQLALAAASTQSSVGWHMAHDAFHDFCSPDVVLSLIAERDSWKRWTNEAEEKGAAIAAENEQLGHLYRKNENDWQNRFDEMKSERDEYQRAADMMAASHKVERDALLDSRRADEALMRESLKVMNCTNLKCSDFHHKKADQHHHLDVCKPLIQYEIVLDKLRARLGGL